ncbi:hypothetical protein BDR06DRAFT_772038 [Suillus hirtellus]|nr:hypothetical protein BDR06DRAFT_772038 [Suillus hirtellus]
MRTSGTIYSSTRAGACRTRVLQESSGRPKRLGQLLRRVRELNSFSVPAPSQNAPSLARSGNVTQVRRVYTATITNRSFPSRGLEPMGAPTVPAHTSFHSQSHISPTLAHAVEVYCNFFFKSSTAGY